MARAYYSVVLDHPADAVWEVIRSFGDYDWSGVVSETVIEAGKAGDQVGAVRRVRVGDRTIRQQLLAHSDIDQCYTYAFLEPAPVPNYRATIQVLPVTDGDRAFVQWTAWFDCTPDAIAHWTRFFARDGFAQWLAALRAVMADRGATTPR